MKELNKHQNNNDYKVRYSDIFGYEGNIQITYKEYESFYPDLLSEFLNRGEDYTELYFIEEQIKDCNKFSEELRSDIEYMESADFIYSVGMHEYLRYFINRRTIPFNEDVTCGEVGSMELSELGLFMRYAKELKNAFNNRIATNYKILEYLRGRKELLEKAHVSRADKNKINSAIIPSSKKKPITYEQLFKNPQHAELALEKFKETFPDILSKNNEYIGKAKKGYFGLFISVLRQKELINIHTDIEYKNSLNDKIHGLNLSKDASELRKNYKRVTSSDRTDFKLALENI